jgi:hypothetical protein
MKLRAPFVLPLLALTLAAACSSAPAETSDDASADAMKETKDTMAADALGPLSLYFGDTLAASVDADGRFLAGDEAAEPGAHAATFTADGTLTFVDTPDMKMVLAEDGTISMVRGDGQSQVVPISIGADGTVALLEGNMADRQMSFDADGNLTSNEPLPSALMGARMEGYSKVSPRHAAYVFVVTSMFMVVVEDDTPDGTLEEPPPEMGEEGAPAPGDAEFE